MSRSRLQSLNSNIDHMKCSLSSKNSPRNTVDFEAACSVYIRFRGVNGYCLEKRTEIQTQLAALTAKFPQPARGRDSVARCIKDLLEPETNLVQRPQRRDLLKEGLQRLLLLGTQTLGIAAEGPHLGPKDFSLVLGQLRLVFSSDIFLIITGFGETTKCSDEAG